MGNESSVGAGSAIQTPRFRKPFEAGAKWIVKAACLSDTELARVKMTEKKFVVRRTVQLLDIQEFTIDRAVDECDAQRQALALIRAFSAGKPERVDGARQTICEIVDAGESADWRIQPST